MSPLNLAPISLLVAFLLVGCGKHDAGNRDREHCEGLRVGMPRSEVIAHMGPPRQTRGPLPGYAEEILIYNHPSLPGLPMFGAGKDVEVLLERVPSGVVLKEALCSGDD